MTADEAVKINERIGRERIFNCSAGFENSTPLGDGSFERCNVCGGIFWHERYSGAESK